MKVFSTLALTTVLALTATFSNVEAAPAPKPGAGKTALLLTAAGAGLATAAYSGKMYRASKNKPQVTNVFNPPTQNIMYAQPQQQQLPSTHVYVSAPPNTPSTQNIVYTQQPQQPPQNVMYTQPQQQQPPSTHVYVSAPYAQSAQTVPTSQPTYYTTTPSAPYYVSGQLYIPVSAR
ncbi:hypothetical protein BJ684DRAFT_19035 [Piptocephalis cylindrospora]|uniref:Uncharacterized protein n=1 Tax=Piptocephalis cylindrospora TaxID=1907219 RepID=A0A4P9Y981_9FUNG|nr:hypothetical protein BJ684DRAFT_19035 [Piptocephalis cylindrospora]|eukprot:RKP14560.1 hypothetical protein BJ684DRAFT_19035 [Piptocephalis cylindrospora]